MRAAKLLLTKGELPADLSKEQLRATAAAAMCVILGSLYSEADQLDTLRTLIRAVAKIAERSEPLAGAMLARVCYLGPSDATDSIRRLVHEEKVEGWEKVAGLTVSDAALAKIDCIDL